MTTVLNVLVFLAVIQGLISIKNGRRNTRYALNYEPRKPTGKSVVVFCPVKGLDEHLASNLRSLLEQRYTDYRVVFIVDSKREPALQVLSRIDGADVIVAGLAQDAGQKVHNLVQAVGTLRGTPDIFVFADADARFPPDWLSNLVAPLSDSAVGASTGYRWYVPTTGNVPSLIRSAWNASVIGFLGPHRNNFAWGGSTAIQRTVFHQIGMIERWKGAVSDDYALTAAVRSAGLDVVYVPVCLVPCYEECSWRSLLEFTTRQIRMTRVYAPRTWLLGITTYSLFNLTFCWLTLAMLVNRAFLLPWLGIYTLSVFRAHLRLRVVSPRTGGPSLFRYRWFYRLSDPIVALLYQFNFLASFKRKIVWKGVTYTLVSPNETRIDR